MSNCDTVFTDKALNLNVIGPRTVIVPADPIIWDEGKSYEYMTLVASNDFGQGYVSKRDVPSGTPLTNTDYWIPVANFNAQLAQIMEEIAPIPAIVSSVGIIMQSVVNVLNPPNGLQALKTDGTDNTSAFQAILDSVDANGAIIYFPPGVYTFASTVSITHDKVTIVGGNKRGTRLSYTGSSTFINFNSYSTVMSGPTHNNERVIIKNLTISGSNDVRDTIGVNFVDATGCEITDCIIINFKTGISYGTRAISSAGSSVFSGITFVQPAFENVTDAFCFVINKGINALRINDCGATCYGSSFARLTGATDIWFNSINLSLCFNCIYAQANDRGNSDIKITNSVFDGCISNAVRLVNFSKWGTIVSGCWFNMVTNGNDNTPYLTLNSCRWVKIIGNHFGGSLDLSTTIRQRGVICDTCSDSVISNNVFQNIYNGIMGGFTRCAITSNVVNSGPISGRSSPQGIVCTEDYNTVSLNVVTGFSDGGEAIYLSGGAAIGNVTDKAVTGATSEANNIVIS